MTEHYAFGDDDLAAKRLALVAEVFAESSRKLVEESIPSDAGIVLDLGCGPGYSTRMLADACAPQRVLGLDASERYVDLARRLTIGPRVAFAVHDVALLPLPEAPVDAAYVRFLLSHLPDPNSVVEGWCRQLRPGGVLVLDELEAIDAPPGPLRAYAQLADEIVAMRGGTLHVGAVLRPLGGHAVEVLVDMATAARMSWMNLSVWRQSAVAHRPVTTAWTR